MFKFRKHLGIPYQVQGYIHFKSHNYHRLSDHERSEIDELCHLAGGEYEAALRRFLITDVTATKVCIDYFLSKATLYRCVDKYYKMFAERMTNKEQGD